MTGRGVPACARELVLSLTGEDCLAARFLALGGPCEVLIDHEDAAAAERVAGEVAREAWRIEDKFSRYRQGSVLYDINSLAGTSVAVDEETAALLDYADTCFRLSDGSFDVTSGILRRVWRFDGSRSLPSRRDVRAWLSHVGWQRVRWSRPALLLPKGMEIDLGGIGKEYAVDRAAMLLQEGGFVHALVNFGGDLRATGPRRLGDAWMIGIDDPNDTGRAIVSHRSISSGAMATSGDARRFVLSGGRRYGHILDPRTGWPVVGAPRSVTVQAPTCLEAGMLATFGMLKGGAAASFLEAQGFSHFLVW